MPTSHHNHFMRSKTSLTEKAHLIACAPGRWVNTVLKSANANSTSLGVCLFSLIDIDMLNNFTENFMASYQMCQKNNNTSIKYVNIHLDTVYEEMTATNKFGTVVLMHEQLVSQMVQKSAKTRLFLQTTVFDIITTFRDKDHLLQSQKAVHCIILGISH